MKFNFLFFLLLFSGLGIAQDGILRGTVSDGELNDVLPFADVKILNTTKGTSTDFDGNYQLNLEPGIYTISFSFVGYQSINISDVEVKANHTKTVNVTLNLSSDSLDEVIITTTAKRNTEQSVLNLQKSSSVVMDGLSAESMEKAGASNVASAVKRVPGVSIQGGKFVYVRGLGDRYTKSLLNGVDIPGLDPDKNTVQMDIFPSNMIQNVLVSKTASADLPADFTGGVVDINLRDFSAKEEYSISFGSSFNPTMHFNGDFVKGETEVTDFFGFDNGSRDLPISPNLDIPAAVGNGTNANGVNIADVTRSFNPNLGPLRSTSDADFNLSFSTANQFSLENNRKIGYQAAFALRNTVEYFEDFEQNFFFKPAETEQFQIIPNRTQIGDVGIRNNLMSALGGVSYQTEQSKYKFNIIHLQNAESKAGLFTGRTLILDDIEVKRDNIEYSERALTNLLFEGKHTSKDANWITEWKVSPSFSKVEDKDVRVTPFEVTNQGFSIRPSTAGAPQRIWRNLEEVNMVGKLDFTKKHNLFNRQAKLKFGAAYIYKERDFSIDQYLISFRGSNAVPVNGNSNNILIEDNIWSADNDGGFFIQGNFQPANTFNSSAQIRAAYAMEEFKITEKLKSIVGLRFEQYVLNYTGQNNQGDIVLNDEEVINDANLYPSANFIYEYSDNSNFRLSYSNTTARPSFKEASIAQIFDPLTNLTFVGNIDVEPSFIQNFDVRYERYSQTGGMIALSGFYKDFTDPIEMVAFPTRPTNIEPRNVGSARVLGVEVELRQKLDFTPALEKFSVNMNVSLIDSDVEMDPREFESRQLAARDGQTIDDTRELQGQSPFLINFSLNYDDFDNGWQSGLFYNVQGETLEVVGIRNVPDVYTQPFHNLSFQLTKTFGENNNSSINFGISNLLNDTIRSYYKSFNSESEIFSKRKIGQAFSVGYSLKF
ncbi:TonB-dependent receptor [Psychroflexus salis]|uniref:Outer membrane protein n=1 Tax=Psychroflexus salis TaxID=1526574 RepID=A0A917EA90_9FLAO|nr:TonB-dependent receptor [Psychroflexus salis]GGE14405.1 outer membrane protein [Psychroflexus salis]